MHIIASESEFHAYFINLEFISFLNPYQLSMYGKNLKAN